MAKKTKSLKLTQGQINQMNNALDTLEPHLISAAECWPTLTPEQRVLLLVNSPVLARTIKLTEVFRNG